MASISNWCYENVRTRRDVVFYILRYGISAYKTAFHQSSIHARFDVVFCQFHDNGDNHVVFKLQRHQSMNNDKKHHYTGSANASSVTLICDQQITNWSRQSVTFNTVFFPDTVFIALFYNCNGYFRYETKPRYSIICIILCRLYRTQIQFSFHYCYFFISSVLLCKHDHGHQEKAC